MGETITMKAETGVINLTGAGQSLTAERPLRMRILDVFEDMPINPFLKSEGDLNRYADRILDLVQTAQDTERARCAKIVDDDEHTMAHVKLRLANKIRGFA